MSNSILEYCRFKFVQIMGVCSGFKIQKKNSKKLKQQKKFDVYL